tara:strand:+ start:327 stop:884 length:558 start_codon:yes stop_codon:yes gene_type:complete
MARDLTAGVITEVTAATLTPILLVKLNFDGGALTLWNGIGDLVFSGDTYTGAGDLGGISTWVETEEIRATGLTFSLSAIPASIISTALTEQYQGRSAKVYLGFFDSDDAIISDPYLIFDGRMDVMTIEENGETANITLSAETILIALERANERRYTEQDQKDEYAGDTFFDFVTQLQDSEIIWGS